ncbi:MAG: tripartite tricarboxylate transporter substrate binding protein [Rubritepida sp.]|nr:tripartite tricarboxylate transporter substrate binding protein [Rubritepida sp.]
MSMHILPRRHLLAGGAALAATPAFAQPRWPSRPVRMIAASAPGGPSDVCARVLAERLSTIWGQSVVVENRSGAGGNIGADLVAKAAPDGLTLLMAASSIIAAPFLVPNLSYDPMRDLAPVAEVVDYPMVVLVHPSVPVRTLQELVALARAHPGEVTYSSAGVGNTSHLAPALFAHIAGVEMTHVPFGGAAPSQTAILAGQVKSSFNNPGNSVPSIRAGQLRALAVTGTERWRDLPEVPTVAEQGFPGFTAISWMGLLAPAGTPEPILAQLERDTLAALRDTDVSARLRGAGFEMRDRGRAEFRRVMEADTALWGGFIRQANIRQD